MVHAADISIRNSFKSNQWAVFLISVWYDLHSISACFVILLLGIYLHWTSCAKNDGLKILYVRVHIACLKFLYHTWINRQGSFLTPHKIGSDWNFRITSGWVFSFSSRLHCFISIKSQNQLQDCTSILTKYLYQACHTRCNIVLFS